MKKWVAFVFGMLVGVIGAASDRVSLFRSRSARSLVDRLIPLGWHEADGVYLRDDGLAVVCGDALDYTDWCCSPGDVCVVVDGVLRLDITEAFSGGIGARGERLVGRWRSADDVGFGDVLIFFRDPLSDGDRS